MGILKSVTINNFECFREPIDVKFGDATFLIVEKLKKIIII